MHAHLIQIVQVAWRMRAILLPMHTQSVNLHIAISIQTYQKHIIDYTEAVFSVWINETNTLSMGEGHCIYFGFLSVLNM